ncbi:MAG: sigma-E factor regulatory protein RseB domain-containing protein [Acidobacteriota bacterium]
MRRRIGSLTAWAIMTVAILQPAAPAAQEIRFGQDVDLSRAAPPGTRIPIGGGTEEAPYTSHVEVAWQDLGDGSAETVMALSRRLRRFAEAHHRLVVSLRADPSAPVPGADEPQRLDQWLAGLRQLVSLTAADLVAVEPLRGGRTAAGADREAFFLKRAAVAIRGAAPDVKVVLGLADGAQMREWLAALYGAGVGPYVDVFAWHQTPGAPPPGPADLKTLLDLRLALDPGIALWVLGLAGGGAGVLGEAALVGRLAPAGAALLTFRAPAGERLAHLQARLGKGFTPMSAGGVQVLTADQTPADVVVSRFFNAETAIVETILVPTGEEPQRLDVVVNTFDVSSTLLYDLDTGDDHFLSSVVPDRRANRTRISILSLAGPSLLEYRRFATPGLGHEEVQIGQQRDPPVEEILARHQEVDDQEKEGLTSVRADVTIEFHYSVAGYSTGVDVTFESGYYWTPETGGEFEHRQLLINGARWKRDKLPELPLIQPEKVVTVPLEIHLRKQYRYVLKGRDQVGGRPAWRIHLEPIDEGAARYRGTVWIDRETYRLLKTTVTQTGLEPPVISSEESNVYTLFPLATGAGATLVSSMTGQQIWNTAGASFIVNREMRFSNVRLNDEGFEAARQQAYDSDHQMLRDTEEGLRYVEKDDSGQRVVVEPDSRTRVAIAGGFYNEALDFPVPFAGLSLFDYDFRGKGQQINLFLAGAANFGTWSDPSFFGTRADASLTASLIGFATQDRFFVMGRERKDLEVQQRTQSLSASIGYPVSEFVKLRAFLGVDHNHFEQSDDTGPGLVVPDDTFTLSVSSQAQYDRRGFTATLRSGFFNRVSWRPWGDTDPTSVARGSRLSDFDSRFASYTTWSAAASQDIFLKSFQKIRVEGVWLDGSDLDRFSQYRFSFFGGQTRLRGFSGSGVRFNRGGILRARYSFNIADVVSFDAGVDYAHVKDTFTSLDGTSHMGVGVAGKFIGPWGFIVQVEYGLAVHSAFPEVEGEQEAQLLLLKIF